MIISRTPFRISFFGGGTDYPVWYRENGGSVISTTIDKYCYVSCRHLPPFFDYKHRIVYSKQEAVNDIDEIVHPAVRELFRFRGVKKGLEIHHDGDLPARTGLGSSSSFTVGLLNVLYALEGKMITKERLALDAIHVEQEMIKENIGVQDQIAASFGGFNKIDFKKDDSFEIKTIIMNNDKLQNLQNSLLLCFTGFTRYASDLAEEQIKNTSRNKKALSAMYQAVDDAVSILSSENMDISEFGKLLHESWMLKRSLTNQISTPCIDDIYNIARSAGASGGKLLGAGGGGFMLLFAEPETHRYIKEKLKDFLFVPFSFENIGSQIIVYQPNLFNN